MKAAEPWRVKYILFEAGKFVEKNKLLGKSTKATALERAALLAEKEGYVWKEAPHNGSGGYWVKPSGNEKVGDTLELLPDFGARG